MFKKAKRHIALVAMILIDGPAFAVEQCPVSDAATEKAGGYVEAVLAAVRNAPNCEHAVKILEACQFGDSKTNRLLEIVEGKCEPLFMPKASPAVKTAYKKAQARCDAIAVKNSGTMYQSFAAVCRAGKARDFARKYGQGRG
ncbi:hypothetical protein [Methylocystis heyeri]|uniref:DUF1311 domain-containing protein n=1 Tax=Methylocystis heyeri TaxID=391905 RepID=A0A6B8KFV6_9HYPH|nr:hypothetical protein [Methylocystis heyeri]QGM47206.1 hypothetical protein H2LOC_016730 [Methylocystis heyeri]